MVETETLGLGLGAEQLWPPGPPRPPVFTRCLFSPASRGDTSAHGPSPPESRLPLVTSRWEINAAPVSSPYRLYTSVRPRCSSDAHFSEQPLDSARAAPAGGPGLGLSSSSSGSMRLRARLGSDGEVRV